MEENKEVKVEYKDFLFGYYNIAQKLNELEKEKETIIKEKDEVKQKVQEFEEKSKNDKEDRSEEKAELEKKIEEIKEKFEKNKEERKSYNQYKENVKENAKNHYELKKEEVESEKQEKLTPLINKKQEIIDKRDIALEEIEQIPIEGKSKREKAKNEKIKSEMKKAVEDKAQNNLEDIENQISEIEESYKEKFEKIKEEYEDFLTKCEKIDRGESVQEVEEYIAQREESKREESETENNPKEETGSKETESKETGSKETGSKETGSKETGSKKTGSKATGSEEPKREEVETEKHKINIRYDAKKDEYVMEVINTETDEKVQEAILDRKEFEQYSHVEEYLGEYSKDEMLLSQLEENMENLDENVMHCLFAYDRAYGTDKLKEYIETARIGKSAKERQELMAKSNIDIEYDLRGIYSSKDKISLKDREEILRVANMHKKTGTATVKKGILMSIREKADRIVDRLTEPRVKRIEAKMEKMQSKIETSKQDEKEGKKKFETSKTLEEQDEELRENLEIAERAAFKKMGEETNLKEEVAASRERRVNSKEFQEKLKTVVNGDKEHFKKMQVGYEEHMENEETLGKTISVLESMGFTFVDHKTGEPINPQDIKPTVQKPVTGKDSHTR